MEWMNRGTRPAQPGDQPASTSTSPSHHQSSKDTGVFKSMRLATVVMLFALTALIVAVVAYLVLGGNSSGEDRYVDKTKLQAVFLNGGQVYFGRVKTLNSKYMRVSDIYYLRVNQQVQPDQENQQRTQNDISLVKLGCELHGPQDQMVINRDQVIFWENLKDDGQVAKAVAEYVKQNPNGQQCNQATNNNNTTPSTNDTNQQNQETNP